MKYLYIICVFILFSCRKAGNGYVKGSVLEVGTGLAVPNTIVSLWHKKNKKEYQVIDSVETNAKGEYKIKFHKNLFGSYKVSCTGINNYIGSDFEDITYKKTAITLELNPKAFLKIRVKKNTLSTNYIEYRINGVSSTYITNQSPYDTIIPIKYAVLGNATNPVEWFIYTPNSSHTYLYNLVYVAKNDTVTYLIEFN